MKYVTILIAAMLFGGTAYAGDVIAPPITKYVETPVVPNRPTNFGRVDTQKVAERIAMILSHKDK